MLEDQRPSTVYWIDHYVVPISDWPRWSAFYTNVLGAEPRAPRQRPGGGGGPAVGQRPGGGTFTYLGGGCHVGGFEQDQPLQPTRGLGRALPRYGWYIRPEEIEEHLRRLDRYGVAHTDPLRTTEEGEEGTALRFEDPDGNQLEFWAPARLPDGAMDGETPVKVGRIASAMFETRDLSKAADFYSQFCHVDPARDADIPQDTLVLPLAAGGRLVFKKAETLGVRTGGHTLYQGLHTALVVKDDDFVPNLEHMWANLPEWDYDPESSPRLSADEAERLPARTGLHGNPIGPEWKRAFGRGDSFYDWDTNTYHFVAAAPVEGSMARFKNVSQRSFLERRLAG